VIFYERCLELENQSDNVSFIYSFSTER